MRLGTSTDRAAYTPIKFKGMRFSRVRIDWSQFSKGFMHFSQG